MRLGRANAIHSRTRSLVGRTALLACALLVFGGACGLKKNYVPGPISAAHYPSQSLNGYQSHADFESECRLCHAPVRCLSANLCQDCHKQIARERAEASGLHGLLPGTDKCQHCHTEHQGREAAISAVPFVNVNHERLTGFSLARHQVDHDSTPLTCHSCHAGGRYDADSVECITCHDGCDPDHLATHMVRFGNDCVACHDGVDRMLQGIADMAPCSDCHPTGRPGEAAQIMQAHAESAAGATRGDKKGDSTP